MPLFDKLDSIFDMRAAKIILIASVAVLVGIGLVMVFSATSASLASSGEDPFSDVAKQAIYVGVGVLFMLAIWFAVPYRAWLGRLLWAYWGLCVFALILTFAIGTNTYGAQRWLIIGGFSFQPSEFFKIALLMMMIRIVYDQRTGRITLLAALVQFLVLVGVPLAFLYVTQSDLGSVAICIVGIFAVLVMAKVSWKFLLPLAIVLAAGLVFAIFGVGYRSSRMVYLDPWNDGQDGLGAGYNIIHSYYAFAQGGLFGVGIGASREKYDYLFAADSDFIFAIIGEELGLVGAVFVILLFLMVLFCGIKIAKECNDMFGRMIAACFAIMLVAQAFLNIGCAIGVFPTTGKPLPFISSGGSSVITSLAIIGIILSVSQGGGARSAAAQRRSRDDLKVIRFKR